MTLWIFLNSVYHLYDGRQQGWQEALLVVIERHYPTNRYSAWPHWNSVKCTIHLNYLHFPPFLFLISFAMGQTVRHRPAHLLAWPLTLPSTEINFLISSPPSSRETFMLCLIVSTTGYLSISTPCRWSTDLQTSVGMFHVTCRYHFIL